MNKNIITIRPDLPVETLQRLPYYIGISGNTAGSQHLSLNMVVIPPGACADTHIHKKFESAIYLLQGEVETRYGDQLQFSVVNKPGDFIYIPPDLPHKARNLSETEAAIGLVARNDANEQEDVEIVPGL